MYSSTKDVYLSFLDGIKKSNTPSVSPDKFNIIINEAAMLFFREKSIAIEQDQKKIDDLKELITKTDGKFKFESNILLPINQSSISNIFPLPISEDNSYKVSLDGLEYPNYRRLLNVRFRIVYVNDKCFGNGLSEWLDAKPLKSNEENSIRKNPFRTPKGDRLYYKIIGNNIELWMGDNTENYGKDMMLEYIRYPRPFKFSTVESENSMLEFQPDQIKEIIEIAIRLYLGESSDPRYNISLQERAINYLGK